MNPKPTVPSEPIRALVREYVAKRDMGTTLEQRNSPHTYSAAEAVATEMGIARLTLDKFLNCTNHVETMPFDLADRMLCAMGLVYLWWTKFADLYWSLEFPESKVVSCR